jgi:hypothetical protein
MPIRRLFVSLDPDALVATGDVEAVCKAVQDHFKIERFARSVNLSTDKSNWRIQLQTDRRYQDFIIRAKAHTVLGYRMKVTCVEDVFQGKVWAYSDKERRKSKR